MNRTPILFAIVSNNIATRPRTPDRPTNGGSARIASWMIGVILVTIAQSGLCDAGEGDASPQSSSASASSAWASNGAVSTESTDVFDRDHFVVETAIKMDGQTIDRHQVIFDSGIAYDVVSDGSRFITVFDDDRVTLLDRMTQVRAEVPHATLIDVTQRAAAAARQSLKGKQLGVDVKPVRRGDDYAASFGPFDYVIKTIAPPVESVAADYASFADAAVRLNVMQQVGMPPFARLALSRRIAADGRMPTETTITWKTDTKTTVYSVRTSIKPASEMDRQQAKTLAALIELYQPIMLAEFPAR